MSDLKRMIGQPSNIASLMSETLVSLVATEGRGGRRFEGWVDRFQAGSLFGWATDQTNPFEPAHLIFLLEGRIVGMGRADQRREDVAQALQITTRCGFVQLLPPSVTRNPAGITVLAVDPTVALAVAASIKAAGDQDISIDPFVDDYDSDLIHTLASVPDALDGVKRVLDHEDTRGLADVARDAGDWASAAYFYGQTTLREPKDAELWIRHGDMLKRCGLFDKAELSYVRAMQLRLDDVETLMSLSSLALAQGELRKAASYLQRGTALSVPHLDRFKRDLELLDASGTAAPPIGKKDRTTFYLSCAARMPPDGDPSELKRFLGAAHYSYSYILQGYLKALEDAGYDCTVIKYPEYLPDIRSRSKGKIIHIGFYPPDEPRFLKGAYNITCIAWEFERLRNRDEAKSYHAFSDASTMLARSDEVWAISEFGAEAVRRSGITQVRAVPTPVSARQQTGRSGRPQLSRLQKAATKLARIQWRPLAIIPSNQPSMSAQVERRVHPIADILNIQPSGSNPTIFICIFNVHDYRKQIKPLLESFVRFAQNHPDAYLLLKATSIDSNTLDINTQLFLYQVADPGELTPPLVSDRILVTTDTLSRDEMHSLNDLASFYICTSHAEGQNLPLIEAMGSGIVPISVNHTAMRDYVGTHNAIVIPSVLKAMTPRLVARYELYGVGTYYVDPRAVYAGLCTAFSLSTDLYILMSNASVATVKAKFGPRELIAAIDQNPTFMTS